MKLGAERADGDNRPIPAHLCTPICRKPARMTPSVRQLGDIVPSRLAPLQIRGKVAHHEHRTDPTRNKARNAAAPTRAALRNGQRRFSITSFRIAV